jgi:triosephosphate isomerase (TIM)
MKKRLIIGNWKMYVETESGAADFAKTLKSKMRALPNVEVALAPAHILIPAVVQVLKRSTIGVGAQSVSRYHADAHTGEVSGGMLRAAGASFVIIGHSERRALGETDDIVRKQMLEVAGLGLGIVLCVGEPSQDESGDHFAFIKQQLTSALAGHSKKTFSNLIIAYEPVWAIGKHAIDAMKPTAVQETVIFIRKVLTELMEKEQALKIPILYGGSVEAGNAASYIKDGSVQGLLVGHASASIETFLPILRAANK